MQKTTTSVQAVIDYLLSKLSKEEREVAPGWRFDTDKRDMDNGGYDDPTKDERPGFIQEDEAGWQRKSLLNG